MDNIDKWQYGYLVNELGVTPETTVLDINNGIFSLAHDLVDYLGKGKYVSNVVKKMTLSPHVDFSPIEKTHTGKQPTSSIIQNFQFTASVDLAWEFDVFGHLAVYDGMLFLAKANAVTERLVFSYYDHSTALDPRHINEPKSHPECNFYYTFKQVKTMAKHTGWEIRKLGTQTHPKNMTVVEAVRVKHI